MEIARELRHVRLGGRFGSQPLDMQARGEDSYQKETQASSLRDACEDDALHSQLLSCNAKGISSNVCGELPRRSPRFGVTDLGWKRSLVPNFYSWPPHGQSVSVRGKQRGGATPRGWHTHEEVPHLRIPNANGAIR